MPKLERMSIVKVVTCVCSFEANVSRTVMKQKSRSRRVGFIRRLWSKRGEGARFGMLARCF